MSKKLGAYLLLLCSPAYATRHLTVPDRGKGITPASSPIHSPMPQPPAHPELPLDALNLGADINTDTPPPTPVTNNPFTFPVTPPPSSYWGPIICTGIAAACIGVLIKVRLGVRAKASPKPKTILS